jgi:hypothetical protein
MTAICGGAWQMSQYGKITKDKDRGYFTEDNEGNEGGFCQGLA